MSGGSMAHKVISKVNSMLKFLHRKSKCLTPNLRCLMCNTLSPLHLNLIVPNASFLCPLKTTTVFWCFQGVEKGCIWNDWVNYACSVWYPKFSEKLKNEIQISQNKCIRFCLQLNEMPHISQREFETINWLAIKERFS